ncbi:MAG: lipoate--protein ligase [Peptococcaceae bacterium]|nr:lipoate--protein ligase [Peptococcaceae bacterium]
MITRTFYYVQQGTDPYKNLALEQYLLETVPEGGCILYLWQNRHTVVIGKNQNAWKECKVKQLTDDGGALARRLSGGGAVYHDLGNLNFTFLIHKADYNISRQLEVIVKALELLGIHAEKSGRNDLLASGRKFSGNAFYEAGDRCYHHGTLMVNVDRENLGKYLQVSAAKLKSKGVASVQARVINLTELKADLSLDMLKKALIDAMELVYGYKAEPWPEESMDAEKVEIYRDFYASDEFRLNRKIPFTWELEHRFHWGEIQLQCEANEGKIRQIEIYSDAMDAGLVEEIKTALTGSAFSSKAMAECLSYLKPRQEIVDLRACLLQMNI